ncbi:carbohydrate ABC transporter permease [Paenibacillus psychroresistens]|uniref:Carbohydrate ABC transporter permease n=1 Tax=Paenibacillus psychroresistens TaxID=1778678 RepID=A0A6B8RFM8_9BACL|nr:carbohydrate ABC transporter permease [Paenibacillus psychroresistens]QGQ94534.1 carbohydrate ABC transporter permease [Paenibacillus psychroresistens]
MMENRILKTRLSLLLRYIPLMAWLGFTIVIFGYAILASLSTTREIFSNTLLKSGIHFSNYIDLFKNLNMGLYFLNSVIYTVTACIGIIVVVAPAAYILGRVQFRGKRLVNLMFLSALSLPGLLISIPLFSLFIQLKLTGSISTLILIYVFTNVPFGVFLLTGFFSSIPKELEESAAIDGCGPIKAFMKIIMPIAQPGLITLSIFNFMGIWNDYFFALIFANDQKHHTLALALQSIVYGYTNTGNYAGIFAAAMVVFIPTFILYIFVSRKIVAGITVGSVKG